MRCMPCPSDMGSTAITNTNTPIPPTQCVKLRQNRMPLCSGSISCRIEAPVVVKPETVSKNASTKSGISPENTNGNAPNADSSTHADATTAKPSRAYRAVSFGRRYPNGNPTSVSRHIVRTNGQTLSPYTSAVSRDNDISAASVKRMRLVTQAIMR